MRIIGGRFRGRALLAPRGLSTRPTGARARVALFDTLAPLIESARVADLFAGTGALGLEALSRGAAQVDFYEQARPALEALRANIKMLAATETSVIGGTLPQSIRAGAPYDLVFMDPPWRQSLELPVADRLVRSGRMAADGSLVVETARRDPWDAQSWLDTGLELVDLRTYGDTEMRFFRLRATTAA